MVYLAVVQGSISAGQSLSFGPSTNIHITLKKTCINTYLRTDVSQAFAAANRIRAMRPRENGENRSAPFDLHSLEAGEKDPQGAKIELQNVVFKYPTRDVPVLEGLNMTVSRNLSFITMLGD